MPRVARAQSSRWAHLARTTCCARRWRGGRMPGCTCATRPSRAPTRWPPPGPWRQRSEPAGPFDIVLLGRNSIDGETGQVGPEVAELLDLAFGGGVRRLEDLGPSLRLELEHDDGTQEVEIALPAVLSVAERLCDPCKVDADGRAAVPATRITRLTASELGPGPWGAAGSPTVVGAARPMEHQRVGRILRGTVRGSGAGCGARAAPARCAGPRPTRGPSALRRGPGQGRPARRWRSVDPGHCRPRGAGTPRGGARAARRRPQASAPRRVRRSTRCAPATTR